MNKKLAGIHPGEILQEEFLTPLALTPYRLAKETRLEQKRIGEILKGKRAITADTALRFAKFFGNSAQFWLNIQAHYDLEIKQRELARELKAIKLFKEPAALAQG